MHRCTSNIDVGGAAAILIQADLNLADMLGLDRGSALEQIEKAPED